MASGAALELHAAPSGADLERARREELRQQLAKRDELELAKLQAAKQAQQLQEAC
jgi:hypothetical protein